MFEIFEKFAAQLEGMRPHANAIAIKADYYACRIIDHLQAIEDALVNEGDHEQEIVKVFNLVNGVAQTLDVRNEEDWQILSIVIGTPTVATVVTVSQGGLPRFAQGTTLATTATPKTLLNRGHEAQVLSTGGDCQVILFARTVKPRKRKAVTGDREPGEMMKGHSETIVPDRHSTDQATHIPPTHVPVSVPFDEGGESREIPYPPYTG